MRVIQTGNGHISPASSHPIKKLELQIVSNFLGSVVPQYVVLFVGRRKNRYVLIGFQTANQNH